MSEEKTDERPEIEHGTARDDGALRDSRIKPCSKRMQGENGIYWCLLPEGHVGQQCAGADPVKPIGARR